jgi:hypothetical protein
MAIVAGGALPRIAPEHGGHHGCSEETYPAGTAFAHPSGTHALVNDGTGPVVFTITYVVPEGASPAPMKVDPPPGC